MWRMKEQAVLWLILVAGLLAISVNAHAQVATNTGNLPDGASFLIEVPASWNGTLLLYSHGYVTPGSANPAHDAGDPITRQFLLAQGFALAGSSYAHAGWAIQEALPDQIAVLDLFRSFTGKPLRTIAWGHSLGGIITAGLVQRYPDRFDAALPMCGVLAGSVGTWDQALDSAFAFRTLLAFGSGLQLVDIFQPGVNLGISEQALAIAQATPQGRARIALAAALADTPGWFVPTASEPDSKDIGSQEANQFLWLQQVDFPFVFAFRAELEARAGGNPSSNVGVDYEEQFKRSAERAEVRVLYQDAGLNLDADLDLLNQTARITADSGARKYLEQNIIFNGQIRIPVLTMHTTGDGLVQPQNESAYQDVVREQENGRLLRQTFVHRAGHCSFTPAETITALEKLITRLDTGRWPKVDPEDLNGAATALGPQLNVFFVGQGVVPQASAFLKFKPGPYLRPFDALSGRCKSSDGKNDCGEEFGQQ